jgi:hypothetical protein
MMDAPIRAVWGLNGNNVTFTGELARRAAPWVRLDPGRLDVPEEVAAQPHLRTGFRHPHLEAWAQEHLGELAWAALTLIQAWLAASRPGFSGRGIGSYEAWCQVVGGVLEHAGIGGFLGSLAAVDAEANEERDLDEEAIALWWQRYQGQVITARHLLDLDLEHWLGAEGRTGRGAETIAGRKLRAMRDRTLLGVTVTRNDAGRGWQLMPRAGGEAGLELLVAAIARFGSAGISQTEWARVVGMAR